ncbi:MAG: MFS transporter [Planctomycetaceae bacterium]|nr:MFS transporter [Planctomycetaceae bacterium]
MNSAATPLVPVRTRWTVVAMLMGFTFLGHFNRVGMSVVGNERLIKTEVLASGQVHAASSGTEQVGVFTKQQMGVVYSSFLLIYTICMLPGGWFIDRVGPAAALRWMALGFGVCGILTGLLGRAGLAPAALLSALIVLRGITGATSVPLHPGCARGVALWSSPATRTTANGLVTCGALIGVALSYPLFGLLIDRFQWQTACIISGGALFAFGLLWQVVAPTDGSGLATGDIEPLTLESAPALSPTPPRSGNLWTLLGNRSLLLLTASYAAVGYFQYLFFYWMQRYFDESLKLPEQESRAAAFTVTIAMAVGMGIGGFWSDWLCRRFGNRWGRRLSALVGMGLSAAFALIGINQTDPEAVVALFALALGALGLCEGIFWTASTEVGGRAGGFASAVLNTGGNAGGMLAPVVTPWLADKFGWGIAIGVACGICALGGSLWLGIDPSSGGDDA